MWSGFVLAGWLILAAPHVRIFSNVAASKEQLGKQLMREIIVASAKSKL